MENLQAVFDELKPLLARFEPPLVATTSEPGKHELQFDKDYRTRSQKTGKVTKKHGLYFAGLIIQRSYVGLYFMPIYSHPADFAHLSPALRAMLRGKSCFRVRGLDYERKQEVGAMIARGFEIYRDFGGMVE